uniref:Spire type actin nucleation factor 2 n=1 Tax=Malurus cyaneus samueli TaxID=2593467 RepID=A0A8C5UD17_9PASS
NTDWARLWVQLMRELRHGVKLKKVQEKQFNPLPTEYQLTPFEMLMQDIRARNYKLRKVMVDGDIPPRVKKDAHELILDFIRSRPPLKQVSIKRRLRPLPQKQRTLHEKILEEIRQERKLRPVEQKGTGVPSPCASHLCPSLPALSPSLCRIQLLPCIPHACADRLTSSSCLELSRCPASAVPARPRPRVLLKAPTLAEMEEMNLSEARGDPWSWGYIGVPGSPGDTVQHVLATASSSLPAGSVPASCHPLPDGPALQSPVPQCGLTLPPVPQEFSHPVESLALTVEEMINVRRVLVKAEMEKFLQSKELYSSLRRGKVCCCCRAKFPLFSWPTSCFFCKRLPGSLESLSLPPPLSPPHSPAGADGEEFPHIYAQGSVLRDVCSDCAGFVTDVVSSSRRSVAVLNASAASRRHAKARSLYSDAWLK